MHITIRGIPELADTPDTYLGTLEVLSCKCPSDPNTWPTFPDFSDGELIGMMGSLRTDFVILKWLLLARNNRGTFEITFCVPFLASDETPLSFNVIKPLPRSMALLLKDSVPLSLCRTPIAELPAQWHVEAVFFADSPDPTCVCFTTLDYKDMPGLGLYWRESIAGPSVPETPTMRAEAPNAVAQLARRIDTVLRITRMDGKPTTNDMLIEEVRKRRTAGVALIEVFRDIVVDDLAQACKTGAAQWLSKSIAVAANKACVKGDKPTNADVQRHSATLKRRYNRAIGAK